MDRNQTDRETYSATVRPYQRNPATASRGRGASSGEQTERPPPQAKDDPVSILTLLVVVGIGIALSLTVLFKVDSIAVTGESAHPGTDSGPVRPGTEENLFLADTESARSVLESRLPYLEDVSVSRSCPAAS